MKIKIASLLAIGAVALLGSAQASLIIYDGFNYAASTSNPDPDGGVNGGNGIAYNSTGSVSSTGMRNTWLGTTTSSGLSYGSLPVVGNAITAGGSNDFTTAVYRNQSANGTFWNADPNTSLRVGSVTSGNFGADGTTLYFSWLMQTNGVGTGNRSVLQLTGNGGTNRVMFGLANDGTNFSIQNGSGTLATTSVAASINTTYFLVARIDFASGNDTFKLWVNPTLGGSEGSADATMTGYDLVGGFQQTSFRFNSNTMLFDEFRVGTTWADVTPIPEPTTWALLAGGLTALVIFRRRNRQS